MHKNAQSPPAAALHCTVLAMPAGKTCIELGCGPGLVAACLARLQPACLLLTDGDPQTLVNCSSNMALNGHSVRLLGSWRQGAQLLEQQQQQQQQEEEEEEGDRTARQISRVGSSVICCARLQLCCCKLCMQCMGML
jgi:ribosomal protein L11 methylase PrmA